MKLQPASVRIFATACVVLAAAAALVVQAPGQNPSRTAASQQRSRIERLNVKPGLWETTATFKFADMRQVSPEGMDQVTPEQRAPLQVRMNATSAQNATTTKTVKGCVTAQDLDEAPSFGMGKADCNYNIESSTSTEVKMTYSCTNESAKVNGRIEIVAVDQEHTKGATHSIATSNGVRTAIDSEFTSKWLGPNCESER